ncbi:G-type lectin S-receptor-like serine/threonine-protein kinase, partial [Nymphaea thermarum]
SSLESSLVKWQSFDFPTDTILPTQTLVANKSLYARFLPNNLSTGRFYVAMQDDGNFVGYNELSVPSYDSQTYGPKGKLVFDATGKISVYQWEKNNYVNLSTPVDRIPSPSEDFYFRATIDYDGIFKLYSYSKRRNDSTSNSWNIVWRMQQSPCNIKGICGTNGYCTKTTTSDSLFDCQCPERFSYVDPVNKFFGCKLDFPLPDCRRYRAENYVLRTIDNTNWRGGDYEQLNVDDESKCKQSCLADCLCLVAIYGNKKCYKKQMPLRDSEPRVDDMKAFIKVPSNNGALLPYLPNTTPNDMGKRSAFERVGGVVLFGVSVGLFPLVMIETIILIWLKLWSPKRQEKPAGFVVAEMQVTRFSYKELEKATEAFKEKLGSGSFGAVYRGMLVSAFSQKPIAVKQLDMLVEDGDKAFETEVRVIGRTHHKNLVQLLGFCDEGSHRLLVYEYMEQGSLSSFLFGSIRPEWNLRIQIAVGIARGLMYLHEECSTQIIHCDIKPGNILLHGNLIPKISDFGLAKLLKRDQTRTNTDIRGTKGYIAPEWFRKMAITVKVDVYSYGVMLLEIICCRKNVELNMKEEPSAILVDWAYDCFIEEQLEMLVEHDEDAKNDMKKVRKMVMVALWCIQEDPSLRPTMKKVTQMLEGAVDVAIPPNPSSFISSMG